MTTQGRASSAPETLEERPLIAITSGDPAGIGPEIVLKALRRPELWQQCRPLVVGDRRMLTRAAGGLGDERPTFEDIEEPRRGQYAPFTVPLIDLRNANPDEVPVGRVSAAAGRAAVEYVTRGCDLVLGGAVDAIVTAPLSKEAMRRAGFAYAGHTELLAERTGASRVGMLLVCPHLRVIHVSTHLSLAAAIRRVTSERVAEVIDLARLGCQGLGIGEPRIAVAGLNPHAGEGGLFGDEEAQAVRPAVEQARLKGWDVSGPLAPDTVFHKAAEGEFDIVVAMYHDQGHIPVKLLGFDHGVNVTLGLPIIRTSVDHGTAFDIAGTGRARETSLLAAVDVAVRMVRGKWTRS